MDPLSQEAIECMVRRQYMMNAALRAQAGRALKAHHLLREAFQKSELADSEVRRQTRLLLDVPEEEMAGLWPAFERTRKQAREAKGAVTAAEAALVAEEKRASHLTVEVVLSPTLDWMAEIDKKIWEGRLEVAEWPQPARDFWKEAKNIRSLAVAGDAEKLGVALPRLQALIDTMQSLL